MTLQFTALRCCATAALVLLAAPAWAAGPLGVAVAGAPSLFVLAVAEATEPDAKVAEARPRPPMEKPKSDPARPDRSKQTAERSGPPDRTDADVSALERVSLR
ncbi:hypothetical protein IP91_01160 [Pseudoduganella lurida]|uniref:Uncharacterized protein n=1 Tax=Pseudoduganella lurida TaxID=1036180 RepID=A0A562RNX8_9BURK|nr:hypothetical protein [Pseudoduganella lurida]TWI70080.1 hypothetical protein IP91_01160 [Pseudoduganella lurida]